MINSLMEKVRLDLDKRYKYQIGQSLTLSKRGKLKPAKRGDVLVGFINGYSKRDIVVFSRLSGKGKE